MVAVPLDLGLVKVEGAAMATGTIIMVAVVLLETIEVVTQFLEATHMLPVQGFWDKAVTQLSLAYGAVLAELTLAVLMGRTPFLFIGNRRPVLEVYGGMLGILTVAAADQVKEPAGMVALALAVGAEVYSLETVEY